MSRTEDHREHPETPSLIALAVALLCQLFSLLTAQLADLKRSRNRKPPPDWQTHWPALRQSEWNVRQMQAVGARLILEGQKLDLMTLSWNWVIDPGFNTKPPATYREMHRRFTLTTRFLADAHRYITRHASRIAKRPLRLAATHQSSTLRVDPATLRVMEATREVLHRLRRGRWIARSCAQDGGGSAQPRGPPPNPTADCLFPTASVALRLRSHPHQNGHTASPCTACRTSIVRFSDSTTRPASTS